LKLSNFLPFLKTAHRVAHVAEIVAGESCESQKLVISRNRKKVEQTREHEE
jgi:hypothetical protein